MEYSKTQLIDTLRKCLIFITILIGVTVAKVTVIDVYDRVNASKQISLDSVIQVNNQLIDQNEDLNNYIQWKQCIDGIDGTDVECQECDSLFNPNGDFVY